MEEHQLREKLMTQGYSIQRKYHWSLRVNARYLGTCKDSEPVSPMYTL